MAPMTADAFAKCLVEAGVLTAEEVNRTTRIVIDCAADGAVEIYVQRYGEAEALAKLAPMLGEMIRRGEDTDGTDPGGIRGETIGVLGDVTRE